MQDLIRKLPGVVSTRVGYIGENPASYKSPCRDVSPSLGANDELLQLTDKDVAISRIESKLLEPLSANVKKGATGRQRT